MGTMKPGAALERIFFRISEVGHASGLPRTSGRLVLLSLLGQYSGAQRLRFWSGRSQGFQNARLEQVEPELADVTTMRMDPQHAENRIFADTGCRWPKRLTAAARAE